MLAVATPLAELRTPHQRPEATVLAPVVAAGSKHEKAVCRLEIAARPHAHGLAVWRLGAVVEVAHEMIAHQDEADILHGEVDVLAAAQHSRWNSALAIANAPVVPVASSISEPLVIIGSTSGVPFIAMMPDDAAGSSSYAVRSH